MNYNHVIYDQVSSHGAARRLATLRLSRAQYQRAQPAPSDGANRQAHLVWLKARTDLIHVTLIGVWVCDR